jgi:3-oxo-5-alpha-steroid 4-dehydrogenase
MPTDRRYVVSVLNSSSPLIIPNADYVRKGIIYVIVGAATMTKWALAKHANYRKQFGGAYPKRKAIFPGVL